MEHKNLGHGLQVTGTLSSLHLTYLRLYRKPLYTFDLGAPVGDVAWAPYSSTTFAAVTTDGKVHVYDMVWDRYKPICVQSIVHKRKAKLNQIAFNPTHPIIIGIFLLLFSIYLHLLSGYIKYNVCWLLIK